VFLLLLLLLLLVITKTKGNEVIICDERLQILNDNMVAVYVAKVVYKGKETPIIDPN
jgi:hypothetical protein